jgi:iron(III) transport system permease protein
VIVFESDNSRPRVAADRPAIERQERLPAGRRLALDWVVALTLCLTVLVPLAVVLANLVWPDSSVWSHVSSLLPELLANTFWLLAGVSLGTLALGAGLAWLTVMCEFPGRRFFDWALVLPLALPSYVLGFVLVGLLDFAGPVQSALRGWLGSSAWFPAIRSRSGVILVFTLSLYPYVYLLVRNAFLTQSRQMMEVAQSLGETAWGRFFHVSLPLARPWIGAGALLAGMETLADFGTVSVFNYETFTTAIYKAWFGLFSLPTAAQLASFLVLLAFLALSLENRQRKLRRFASVARSPLADRRFRLSGVRAVLAFGLCTSVLALAFIIPVGQLLLWSSDSLTRNFDARFGDYLINTLAGAGAGAVLIVTAAWLLSSVKRKYSGAGTALVVRIATLGYALPGTVLSVGIFIPLAWLDSRLGKAAQTVLDADLGPVFGGSLLALLLGYCVRFMAVGFGAVDSAMQRISPRMEEASRSLGVNGAEMLRQVHVPLLRGGLVSALVLVFVDITKEMPITLLMRPFGWDNLAVKIFEMTSEGEWQQAALPAIVLVAASLPPVIWLLRRSGAEP